MLHCVGVWKIHPMPRRSFLVLIRTAVFSAALLVCAQPVSAQSRKAPAGDIRWTGPATPVCVYKAVMSDAEIQACTGRPVRYDYRIAYEGTVAVSR